MTTAGADLEESCATRQALERLTAKWRVLLIYALLAGPSATRNSSAGCPASRRRC